MGMGELGAALGDLKVLKEIAPDEANVHFLLGRCYRGLGDRGLAIRCFTEALNLDPKVCRTSPYSPIFFAIPSLSYQNGEKHGYFWWIAG